MEDCLISIVVPVYKVEKHLDRCIESIVNQTYRNLEIILVDDGSTDRCPQLCDDWAARDPRIRVIHKENQGLGKARNTGIECASGEYICFFDSDDYVSHNLIETVYGAARRSHADVVHFGYFEAFSEKNQFKEHRIKLPKDLYLEEEVLNEFLPNFLGRDSDATESTGIARSAWSIMYSMELIKKADWRFVSERDIISEDIFSNLMLYRYVRRLAVVEDPLYFYCMNENSVSRIYRPDRFERNKQFYLGCLDLCEEAGYSSEVKRRCAYPFLLGTIAVLKQELTCERSWREKYRSIKAIVFDDVLQTVLQQTKDNAFGVNQKLLYWALRHKMCGLVFLLVLLRNHVN